MKRILLLLAMSLFAPVAFADPWCALEEGVPSSCAKKSTSSSKNKSAKASTSSVGSPLLEKLTGKADISIKNNGRMRTVNDANEQRTLLPRIMRGKIIQYAIVNEGQVSRDVLDRAASMTKDGLQAWFNNAVKAIHQSSSSAQNSKDPFGRALASQGKVEKGRLEEFADIVPFLQSGVKINRVAANSQDLDLVVHVHRTARAARAACECSTCDACEYDKDGVIHIDIFEENSTPVLLLYVHELGHGLGLADLYPKGLAQNGYRRYSSTDVNGHSSAMWSYGEKLTCDDADGLINLIDLWTANPSKRVTEGWKSLCRRNEWYRNGTTASKPSS